MIFFRREQEYSSIETYLRREISEHFDEMQLRERYRLDCDELKTRLGEVEEVYKELEAKYSERLSTKVARKVKSFRG